jgi:hypothetical protein
MEMTITCPYCNESADKLLASGGHLAGKLNEAGFITNCCNRWVGVYLNANGETGVFRPSKQTVDRLDIEVDISNVLPRKESQRPDSKFTWIFQEGFCYVVRLVPKFMDLEEQGRPWGLGLAQTFTSEHEAHRFADSVDAFFLAMIKEYKETEA